MFEELQLGDMTPAQVALGFGILLGALFGALAERSGFCLRRAVAGEPGERSSARGVWAAAFASAILGTQALVMGGYLDFSDHRFTAASIPALAIILGGLLFGAGAVIARGCISRLTVLTASGNLRALFTMILVAITAHAAMKGVLAPLRVSLQSVSVDFGAGSLAALGGPLVPALILAAAAGLIALRSDAPRRLLATGVLVGLLVPLGWFGTGFLLLDEFDPIPLESLSFTAPLADGLFFVIASTAISAGFGPGLVFGTLLGAAASALAGGRFRVQRFGEGTPPERYIIGGTMMGFGAVLAGGCTVGAGLSGSATLGISGLLALAATIGGAMLASRLRLGSSAATIIPAE